MLYRCPLVGTVGGRGRRLTGQRGAVQRSCCFHERGGIRWAASGVLWY